MNDSKKPTDKLERVRIPENGCIKPNSPGRSPESRREESHRPGNDTNTSHARPEQLKKLSNSPVGAKIRCISERNGSGSHADGLTVRTDVLSVETDTKTAGNASRKVKMCHRRPKTRNSPIGHEIETVKHPG